MAGRFEVYRDQAGQYRFRLKASNGQIIAESEAYSSKEGARRGCEAAQRASAGASIEDAPGVPPGGPAPGGGPGGDGGTVLDPHPGVDQVVVLVQENHTTDNYFGGLARRCQIFCVSGRSVREDQDGPCGREGRVC